MVGRRNSATTGSSSKNDGDAKGGSAKDSGDHYRSCLFEGWQRQGSSGPWRTAITPFHAQRLVVTVQL